MHEDSNQSFVIDGGSSDNQSVLNSNEILLNETQTESIADRSHDQLPSANISNEITVMLESQNLSNTSNENSSRSSISESINIDFNMTELSMETNHIDETTTTTTPSPLNHNNNNEVMPPIMSSPWLKGMLVNTKSLPELFKVIEKLNFNLTLSNRYLQELSQHYV
jgi:hypothetical protein